MALFFLFPVNTINGHTGPVLRGFPRMWLAMLALKNDTGHVCFEKYFEALLLFIPRG